MPAAGRLQIDYTDELMTSQTFWADNSTITYDATQVNGASATMIGKAVMLSASADDTVSLTSDAANIVGKLLKVEPDLACTVQIQGFTTLPGGLAASLTRGQRQIGATGTAGARGYIRDAIAAELIKAGPVAIATATATAVVVLFG